MLSTEKTVITEMKDINSNAWFVRWYDELKNRNTHLYHHHLENDITTPEASSAIKSIKLGKAPGPDGIHNEFTVLRIAEPNWYIG